MSDDARGHIKRGIFWLGLAQLIARLLDAGSVLIILIFLSREAVGLATLAWAIAVILEAFNGLGIGAAMLQAKTISARQIDAIFIFTMSIAALLFLGVSLAAPWIARGYGAPELTPMIIASVSKLLFVGAALVPLQLLNRALAFKQIGVAQTLASLGASLLKVALAATGFGAWALVIGYTSHGLFLLIGVGLLQPYRPRLRFTLTEIIERFGEIADMIRFGLKVATSGVIYHFYRNADYLLLGAFFGKEAVGVYRVAFDMAMTPAMTLLGVANRAAFPVFSRLAAARDQLADAFLWIQGSLALLVAPIAVFLTFAATDLLRLIGKDEWLAAGPIISVLCWAALLRSLAQIFPQLFHACGKPEYAIYDSLLSVALLIGMFWGALRFFSPHFGLITMAYAWLLSYPALLLFLWLFARRLAPLSARAYLGQLRHPAASSLAAAALA
ncbi:oligosaccharide flippase family protein, partial [Myxococcota bacterium]|nr:oligosaccharide flippase family protein [Myxococcota bacterium]